MRSTVLILLCAAGAWAQAGAGAGAVTGKIEELSGDGIPDTAVTLTNKSLGLERVMTTTDDGVFTAPSLTPARGYQLKASVKDFDSWQSAEFEVSTGETINFVVTLRHAESTGEAEPEIPEPEIHKVRTGVSTLITQPQVENLPVNPRTVDPLLATARMVGIDDHSGQLVLTGQPFSNMFLQDGIAATNTYTYERPGMGKHLSLDSAYELQVLSADYPPEFGDAMGGVVNSSIRGGSTNFHGSAYEYFTDSSLEANGRYSLGRTPLDRQNQFGASLGGPILSHKVFFFANAEVRDARSDSLNRITNPAVADPVLGFAGNCKATAAQCAKAIQYLLPQMNVPVTLTDRFVTGLGKIDYRRSDRNQFSVEGNVMNGQEPLVNEPFSLYNFGQAMVAANPPGIALSPLGSYTPILPNGGMLGLRNSTDDFRLGRAAWTSAPTANTSNELRFGIFENHIFDPAFQPNLSTGNVGVTIAGVTVGNPHPNADSIRERRYELTDNITAASNSHVFRFGVDYWVTRDAIDQMNSAGLYVYPSLTTFAQDFNSTTTTKNYSLFTQDFGNGQRALDSKLYNLYAMDTWRPWQRLTIIYGVRFEKPSRPQPSQVNPTYYQTGSITTPNIDFAPRISIALQATENTVLRFGYAWFYEPMPGQLLDALYMGNAVGLTDMTVNPTQAGAPRFPNVIPLAGGVPSGTANIMYSTNKLRDPHTTQYTIAGEHTFGGNTTLSLSAIRTRGFNLWTLNDANLQAPSVTKTYAVNNAVGQQVNTYSTLIWTTKNDPGSAHVYNVLNSGKSWYDAVSAEIRRRMTQGISLQVSYTWSHAIDNVGGPPIAGFLPLNMINGTVDADRGPTPFDQRQRASIAAIYQPTLHSGSPILRRVANGWTISGIGTLATGEPFTPVVMAAGQEFSSINMAYTNSLNGSGGWNRVPFYGIGSLRTPSQYDLDARISRTIGITERFKATLALDAFNALNMQYNTGVNTVAYNAAPIAQKIGIISGPTTGVLTPVGGLGAGNVASPARILQLSLRLMW